MLVLSRKVGESIQLELDPREIKGGEALSITVTVVRVDGGVRLGFDAPQEVRIARTELLDRE